MISRFTFQSYFLFFTLFLFNITSSIGQDYVYDWAKIYGGTSFDEAFTVTTDDEGNVYTSGIFRGTVDLDPSPGTHTVSSAGISDMFIQKLDIDGNFEWAISYGSSEYDYAQSHAMDSEGNLFVIGLFSLTIDFDPGLGTANRTAAGEEDMFVLKLNSDGDFLWVQTFGSFELDYGRDIFIDASDYLYITGDFRGTVDFDGGPGVASRTSNGDSDIFVLKLDPSGNFVWVSTVGGPEIDHGMSITVDSDGNVISTGQYKNTVDFNPGAGVDSYTSTGNFDTYVQKLDADGNYLWTKTHGSSDVERAYSITVDTDGNIYSTGAYSGTVDFDSGPGIVSSTSNGEQDIYILKLSSTGDYVWSKATGGWEHDIGHSILIDSDESLIISGSFGNSVDFDYGPWFHNLTSTGLKDIFIQKLDLDGEFIWTEQIGGTGNDFGNCIDLNAGALVVSGKSSNTVDFDYGPDTHELTAAGFDDCFTLRLLADTTFIYDTIVTCSDYTWVDGMTYTASEFELEYVSEIGSTIYHLHLTVDPTFTFESTDEINACETYTWIDGEEYTESTDAPTLMYTSVYGCDSIVNLNLTINHPSTTTDTVTACNSYLWTVNDETYHESHIDTAYFDTEFGCDSIRILDLTIHYNDTTTESVTACNNYFWELTAETYSESANHTAVLTNALGCDSIIELELTIISNDLDITRDSLTITASCLDAIYQWVDCDNDFEPIVAATDQSYTFSENGNYAVIITKDGCTDTSECISINDVSIKEPSLLDEIRIFPNPTTGDFAVDFGTIDWPKSISVYNPLGQKISNHVLTNESLINLELNGESGIYLIQISTEQESLFIRIVKT